MSPGLLAATVGLLLANGFFVAAEFALTAARRSRLEELASKGDPRARLALASAGELSMMLAGAQLGITMASLGLGYVAEPAIAHALEAALHGLAVPEPVVRTGSYLVALAIVVFLHMVVGEMAPKNVAIAEPERSTLWIALPFRGFINLLRPFIVALNAAANATLRVFGVEPVDALERTPDPRDLAALIAESARAGKLDPHERRLLFRAVEMLDLDAAAVMVPRTDMVAAPVDATPAELERIVVELGHSRVPLYEGTPDNVVGFFHAKDLLRIPEEERERPLPRRFVRPLLVVPESRRLLDLLLDMRRRGVHFALVVDEHGGTAGVVSLEDVVEALVGELAEEPPGTGIRPVGPSRWIVPGGTRLHELAEKLGLRLPEGDYETLAGFLMDRLQRIPRRRDVVELDGWRFRVRSMQRRRVVDVLVEGPPEGDGGARGRA